MPKDSVISIKHICENSPPEEAFSMSSTSFAEAADMMEKLGLDEEAKIFRKATDIKEILDPERKKDFVIIPLEHIRKIMQFIAKAIDSVDKSNNLNYEQKLDVGGTLKSFRFLSEISLKTERPLVIMY